MVDLLRLSLFTSFFQHFQQYRQSWLMFSQALNSLPSENFKISRDQNKPSSLLKLLEISDLHRYITEFL